MSSHMSAVTPEILQEGRRAKRLTLISVALNLFFVAIAATWVARSYFAPSSVVTVTIDRSAGARIERIAQTLPPADAEIKESFRAQPYNIEVTRKAMADARMKHQRFIALLHEEIAAAAAKMSPAGRAKLAEYSSARVTIKPDR